MLGADASKYSNLCTLCAGTGAEKCSDDSSKNKYVGYHGAFKCMGDGKGDVAFVKHTTTQEVVDTGGYGALEDYEYICKDGTRKGKTYIRKTYGLLRSRSLYCPYNPTPFSAKCCVELKKIEISFYKMMRNRQ